MNLWLFRSICWVSLSKLQAVPIEWMRAEIAWTVEKLYKICVNWKSSLPAKFWVFCGKLPPWKFLEALRPRKAPAVVKPRCLTYRLSKSAELFLLGVVTRNEQKWTNRTLILCWIYIGRTPFIGLWWVFSLKEFPERNELCSVRRCHTGCTYISHIFSERHIGILASAYI
jgi:hypothetical protein